MKIYLQILIIVLFSTSHAISLYFHPNNNDKYWVVRLGIISLIFLINKLQSKLESNYVISKYLEGLFYSFIFIDVADRIIFGNADFHVTDLLVIFMPFIGKYFSYVKDNING